MGSQPTLHILITRQQIEEAINKLAAEVTNDYRTKCPLLIGILKGSFIFMADLVRRLNFPLEVDFIRLLSYGDCTESSGRIKMVPGLLPEVRGRDVLVIEDIVDTGLTTAFLLDYLQKKRPTSLKLCVLTDKPSRRRVPITIDYLGLTLPDKFVVGYGLDWDEKFRNLPDMYVLEDDTPF